MDIKSDNFYLLCRICLMNCEKNQFFNIFNKKLKNTNILLSNFVTELTNIFLIEDDNLPQNICSKCENKFNEAYKLKKQTKLSYEKLLEHQKELTNRGELIESIEYAEIEELENEDEFITSDIIYEVNNEMIDQVIKSDVNSIKVGVIKSENSEIIIAENQISEDDAVSFLSQLVLKSPKVTKQHVTYENRRHSCEVCHKKFVKKSNLIDHLRLHANVRNYRCEECGKTFVQSGNYKSHLRIHNGIRPFSCSICNKTYNQSSALKIHMRTHTNEKNYSCDICSKRFTNSSDLGKHKRIHDAIKKFACNECDKRFAQKNHLNKHVGSNHKKKQ